MRVTVGDSGHCCVCVVPQYFLYFYIFVYHKMIELRRVKKSKTFFTLFCRFLLTEFTSTSAQQQKEQLFGISDVMQGAPFSPTFQCWVMSRWKMSCFFCCFDVLTLLYNLILSYSLKYCFIILTIVFLKKIRKLLFLC